jgi:DNA-binding XRE family transcriptional regulator
MRNRLQEQRTQRGMSEAEVAAALGVSPQTMILDRERPLPAVAATGVPQFFDLPGDKMFDPEDEESGT